MKALNIILISLPQFLELQIFYVVIKDCVSKTMSGCEKTSKYVRHTSITGAIKGRKRLKGDLRFFF